MDKQGSVLILGHGSYKVASELGYTGAEKSEGCGLLGDRLREHVGLEGL